MRPILLIMWTAFQSFILRHNNNNNNYNTYNNLYTGSSLHNEWYSMRPCKFHAMDSAFQILDSWFLTVELGFWIKKPRILNSTRKNCRILDSTSRNFPDSGIRIPLHGVTYMWNHGGNLGFFWDSLEVSICYLHFWSIRVYVTTIPSTG